MGNLISVDKASLTRTIAHQETQSERGGEQDMLATILLCEAYRGREYS
jgi:hypothetical protein